LFDELQVQLRQQTATTNVLRVISRSTFDLESVLNTLIESAVGLCDAESGTITREMDGVLYRAASYGFSDQFDELVKTVPIERDRGTISGRTLMEGQVVQIPDVESDPEYTWAEAKKRGNFRTLLGVPLLREGVPIGIISLARRAVRPFDEKQIELATTFADQAVVAIENVRLFEAEQQRTGELTESLQQQTATADVLKVISRSAFDLKAVFETVAESSVRLCGADRAFIFRFDGELLRMVVAYNTSEDFAEFVRQNPIRPGRHSASARAALESRTIHIPDIMADPEYSYGAKNFHGRTVVSVPILKGDDLLGVMAIFHLEVRPFTDKQIALVETFADQAAIAIENTRLLNELHQRTDNLTESLEQQAATSEILRVISRSPTDIQPVFDTIAQSAARLTGALLAGVYRFDGELIHCVAHHNWTAEGLEALRRVYPRPLSRETQVATAILDRKVVHVPDFDDPGVPAQSLTLARSLGYRSILVVPMLSEGNPVGTIAVARAEVGPFSETQIELLQTFADQAVIAIENVRLFDELRQSLQQQTATADVLKVISRSTFDLRTVLNTLIESAAQLCEADLASIPRQSGAIFDHVATFGYNPNFQELLQRNPMGPGRGTITGRVMLEGKTTHIPDVLEDPEYKFVEGQKAGGYRTLLSVPLMREGAAIGVLVLGRSALRPFTAQQIEQVLG